MQISIIARVPPTPPVTDAFYRFFESVCGLFSQLGNFERFALKLMVLEKKTHTAQVGRSVVFATRFFVLDFREWSGELDFARIVCVNVRI